MKINAFSDLARAFSTQAQVKSLKSDQSRLSAELTSGRIADPARRLTTDMVVLSDVTRRHALSEQYLQTNRETSHMLDMAQTTVTSVQETAERFVETLIVTAQDGHARVPEFIGLEAEAALASIADRLNVSVAGRQIFSGQATQTQPLPNASDLRDIMMSVVSGATSAAEVEARVDAYFAEGGAFETTTYAGAVEGMEPVSVSGSTRVGMDLRADLPAFREIFRATMLTVAAKELVGISRADQDRLADSSFDVAVNARDMLVSLSGEIGILQEQLEIGRSEIQAELSATDIVRTELLAVDPFETASRLEDVNTRLEFLYAITARSRNLSFLEFMR